ncbi:hypothetical protein QCD70_10460 [Agreia sp. PsM10]|uniref:hypothetical protein n=1 Tax=Agreia sp. PsM10 TaxID=3030533 RepID=UPI00263A73F4|nr:hypothetical protein [Agreia sp. PsM10]MDN4640665.1 hypothetical protein [Agreia sp. PsM10]
MQKKSLIVAGSALVALSLVAAAPAQAADTVTTSDVAPAAWTQVLNPYTTDAPADFNFFADYELTTEPLTFPFVTPNVVVPAGQYGIGFDLAWIAPAPAESCTRVVNGFTVSITNPTSENAVVGVGLASSSDGVASVDPGTVVDPSGPLAGLPGVTSGIVAPGTTQDFVATLESPTAYSSDISAIVALQGQFEVAHSWTVNSVTFNVTDTCAEAVIMPTEVVTPVVQPALADTGADFTPMGLTAGALLLGGIVAVGAVSATRRIRNTRP